MNFKDQLAHVQKHFIAKKYETDKRGIYGFCGGGHSKKPVAKTSDNEKYIKENHDGQIEEEKMSQSCDEISYSQMMQRMATTYQDLSYQT